MNLPILGKTLIQVRINKQGDNVIYLTCSDGTRYTMSHSQDCCESVYIDDIVGDVDDLIGNPLLIAEEETNKDSPKKDEYDESYTWTFYKLATIKGYVTIKWYGTSNGYYSESADFGEIDFIRACGENNRYWHNRPIGESCYYSKPVRDVLKEIWPIFTEQELEKETKYIEDCLCVKDIIE